MRTPTIAERRENVIALIHDKQREIYKLERFLLLLDELAAQQIAPLDKTA